MPSIPLTRRAPPRPPCLSLKTATDASPPFVTIGEGPNFRFSLFGFKPKHFHFLKPCSSLRETKKTSQQTLSIATNTAPQSLRRILNFNQRGENYENKEGGGRDETAVKGTILAGLLLVGVGGGFETVGYIYKELINAFLTQFLASLKVMGQLDMLSLLQFMPD